MRTLNRIYLLKSRAPHTHPLILLTPLPLLWVKSRPTPMKPSIAAVFHRLMVSLQKKGVLNDTHQARLTCPDALFNAGAQTEIEKQGQKKEK